MIRFGRKMERYEIVYRLSSDSGFTGTIEVHELANTMVAFADTVEEALAAYGAKGELEVEVKPFKQGSFIMELVLQYEAQLVSLFSSPEASALVNVLTLLGFTGTAAKTLPKAVRKVQGKINEARKTEKGTYVYGDGEDAVELDENENNVVRSPKVAKKFNAATMGPIKTIDKSLNVQILEKSEFENGKTDAGEVFDQGDMADLDMYEHVAVEGVPEETEEIVSIMQNVVLSPVNGSYRGADHGYTFRSDRNTLRGVKIHDLSFLQKLESGEVRLMGHDVLVVDLECSQSLSTKSGKVTHHYTITEVKRYIKHESPHQTTIDDAFGEEG